MVRSLWKGVWIDEELKNYNKISNMKIVTKARSCTIIPYFLKKRIYIYNGKKYIGLSIGKQAMGRKLGEYSMTKRIAKYKKKKKK
uniref:Ribosomal protein S19 n=1 Tax=Cavenderia fasciculata TaxID=261658 RepID=B2XX94_CACFS|nr:ribosomal protein S19 [Cavenderia fasciculata]ABX45216.1 ribosomal protein S19 [Cavenderia fasciculata]